MANTYGSSGNRWWVGLNVTSNAQTFLDTGNPRGNSSGGYESLPSGNASDDAQFAAAAVKDKSGTPVQISVENIEWYNIQGPYATQAKANAAIPAIQSGNPAPGSVAQLKQSSVPGAPLLGDAAQKAGAAASDVASVTDFLSRLTSGALWIRVAKCAVGGVILIVGLAKLTGADKAVGGVAAKAVKVAPFL